MSAVRIAEIAKDDYESFRVILKDKVPASYDGWLTLAKGLRNDVLKRGKDVKPVEVNADEFSEFLTVTASSADASGLCKFAREKITKRA